MQGGCGPPFREGHLSGKRRTVVSDDGLGFQTLPSEEMWREPWYIRNNPKIGKFRRITQAVFKFQKGSGRQTRFFAFSDYKK